MRDAINAMNDDLVRYFDKRKKIQTPMDPENAEINPTVNAGFEKKEKRVKRNPINVKRGYPGGWATPPR